MACLKKKNMITWYTFPTPSTFFKIQIQTLFGEKKIGTIVKTEINSS